MQPYSSYKYRLLINASPAFTLTGVTECVGMMFDTVNAAHKVKHYLGELQTDSVRLRVSAQR